MDTEYVHVGRCSVCGHRILLTDSGGCINGHPADCITERECRQTESEEQRLQRKRKEEIEERVGAVWLFKWAVPALSVMLALAVLPMPSGYYGLLRWTALVVGVFAAWQSYGYDQTFGDRGVDVFLFATIAAVWAFAQFPRELWIPLDIIAAAATAYLSYSECKWIRSAKGMLDRV
jgi:hypothetical protein